MIVSLSLKYNLMFYLILLFLIKESLMLLMGYNALKLNSINSARWHGKVNTFSLYFVISILLVFSNINTKTANIFIIINICLMILSLILYICFYYNKIKEVKIY